MTAARLSFDTDATGAGATLCHLAVSLSYLMFLTGNYLLLFDPNERPRGFVSRNPLANWVPNPIYRRFFDNRLTRRIFSSRGTSWPGSLARRWFQTFATRYMQWVFAAHFTIGLWIIVIDCWEITTGCELSAYSWTTVVQLEQHFALGQYLCFRYIPSRLTRELKTWCLSSWRIIAFLLVIVLPLTSTTLYHTERALVNTMIMLCANSRLLRMWRMSGLLGPAVRPTDSWIWRATIHCLISGLCEVVSAWTIATWLTVRISEKVLINLWHNQWFDVSNSLRMVLAPLFLSITDATDQALHKPVFDDPAPANVN